MKKRGVLLRENASFVWVGPLLSVPLSDELVQTLLLVQRKADGDDSGDGVGHYESDPDALDAHHVAQKVHEGHRADHVTKQAAEGGENDFLNRLEIDGYCHRKIAQAYGDDDDTRGAGGNFYEFGVASGKEGADGGCCEPDHDRHNEENDNLVLDGAGERLLEAIPGLGASVEGGDGLQAVGEALGDHHDDVEDVAVDDGEGGDVERAEFAAEGAEQRVCNRVEDERSRLDQEERETDLEDLTADGHVELEVCKLDLELRLLTPDEPEGADGPDADGQAVVDTGAHGAELEDEGREGEPDDGDDSGDRHEVGLDLYLLVNAHDRGDHLAHDREGQQDGEGANAQDRIGHDVGGCAKERTDGLGEDRHDHREDERDDRGEPEALAKGLARTLDVAGAQKVAHDGGNARAKEVAEGQVEELGGHDDRDACQAVGAQAPAHDKSLEDDHDDLGEHALTGYDRVAAYQAGNRL